VLVAAAVCPHPPLLIPEVAVGAAAELDALRTACDEAVGRLTAAEPDVVVIVGAGVVSGEFPPDARGSLVGYGVAVGVLLGETGGSAAARLPLSLTIGTWLLHRSGWTGERIAYAVADGESTARYAQMGAELAARAPRVALLVMGDGSACRTEKAPGYIDERAEPFDSTVAAALGKPDPDALLALDPDLARDLLVAGRAAWQVLAGAASGQSYEADLLYDDAPYGVGYLVATWTGR
jgi:hypothetical protein